jgi:hypothetical protein
MVNWEDGVYDGSSFELVLEWHMTSQDCQPLYTPSHATSRDAQRVPARAKAPAGGCSKGAGFETERMVLGCPGNHRAAGRYAFNALLSKSGKVPLALRTRISLSLLRALASLSLARAYLPISYARLYPIPARSYFSMRYTPENCSANVERVKERGTW